MGCPSEVIIEDNLTFSIATHDPDTGVSTDADAVPTYRVYEENTEVAILNGNMDDGSGGNSEFDDANTVGLYVKTIACTAANGFENGKSYTIFCSATVDGDTGGITYGFKAITMKPVNVIQISGSATAADNLEASAETIVVGTVSHDNTAATETVFYCDDIVEPTENHYNGRVIIFTSGTMLYQATSITAYSLVAGEGKFTVTALTEAPPDDVTFVIV